MRMTFMRRVIHFALLLTSVGLASIASAQAPAAPEPVDPRARISVGDALQLRIALPQMPPTRTTCEVRAGNEAMRLEWDPVRSTALEQNVTLPAGAQVASVSCFSDPLRPTLHPECNLAWTFKSKKKDVTRWTCQSTEPIPTFDALTDACAGMSGKVWEVTVSPVCELPSLIPVPGTGKSASDATVLTVGTTSTLGGSASATLRSVGGISDEAIQNAFASIASVVVDRVKGAALHELRLRVMHSLRCDKRGDESVTAADQKTELGMPLPRTCKAIGAVRLEELAGSGRQILGALVSDMTSALADAGLSLASPRIADSLGPPMREALSTVAELSLGNPARIHDSGLRLARDLSRQSVLEAIGQLAQPPCKEPTCTQQELDFGNERAAITTAELELAFAVSRECTASGSCDAGRVDKMLRDPTASFASIIQPNYLAHLQAALAGADAPRLSALVERTRRVIVPPPGTTEADRLSMSLDLAFDLLEFSLKKRALLDPESTKKPLRFVAEGRALAVAAAHSDLVAMASAASELFPALAISEDDEIARRAELRRVGRVVAVLGAFMQSPTYGDRAPTDEEVHKRDDARKQALTSLIDSLQVRAERHDQAVWSFGSSLGAAAGARLNTTGGVVAPRIGVGFAMDYYSRGPCYCGLHVELDAIDIGAYAMLRTDEGKTVDPRLADVFSPSATVGMAFLLPASSIHLFVGGYVGATPAKDSATSRDVAAGAILAAYVPIFDFN